MAAICLGLNVLKSQNKLPLTTLCGHGQWYSGSATEQLFDNQIIIKVFLHNKQTRQQKTSDWHWLDIDLTWKCDIDVKLMLIRVFLLSGMVNTMNKGTSGHPDHISELCTRGKYHFIHGLMQRRTTVQCLYNAVSFLQIPHNRHPIEPWGRDMGCLLWIPIPIYVLPQ